MTCSVQVELVGLHEEEDLLAHLRGRGLAAVVLDRDGETTVQVAYQREEEARLRDDVWAALRAWLADSEVPLVPSECDGGRYVLHPPGE